MNQLKRWGVWLRRIGHCRGFGIQSPNDYWFVRNVVNEHWPYYQYSEIGQGGDWLTAKLGRLYLRLANWRQPQVVVADGWAVEAFRAGCWGAHIVADAKRADLLLLRVEPGCESRYEELLSAADERSVLVVEGIWRDGKFWRRVVDDVRTGVTFDLYYCGIVMFDGNRTKQNYVVNF